MIVQCANCNTKFNLDETKIGSEGAWVRCSKCNEVFQVNAPEAEPKASEETIALDLGLNGQSPDEEEYDLDLGMGGDPEPQGSGVGKFFKIFFWTLATILILAMLFVGGLVALDRLALAPGFVDQCRNLPGISVLLSPGGTQSGSVAAGGQETNMDLKSVRGFFRINQRSGKLFIIQGVIQNNHPEDRTDILVMGKLLNAEQKVLREAVIYAGPVFTPEELKNLSIKDMQVRLGSPEGSDGSKYVVPGKGTIPFMIVFANLPPTVQEYITEIKSSEPLGAKKPGQ
ncbi:zinc-ribbon domain-containing protein [Dethiosulfatarculus sandiegensis]|uniref:Zinc finger/thioredoxin putative domain-containing protein n=1 Tax=Dethiosulfatarculus sandiegensis TaxID=1429043 RepID=A0A0D2IZX4_9BACT|nr:zinc-ribbon domain-containing protein [Dethiosulfatarculus sandiegensis]KIX11514.1 hypothetical protein X474_23665 [Dethiosulfatarculus sandiegensis]